MTGHSEVMHISEDGSRFKLTHYPQFELGTCAGGLGLLPVDAGDKVSNQFQLRSSIGGILDVTKSCGER
jgi:hypothetical protein